MPGGNNEEGYSCVMQYFLSNTPHQDIFKPSPAMRTHHNNICMLLFGKFKSHFCNFLRCWIIIQRNQYLFHLFILFAAPLRDLGDHHLLNCSSCSLHLHPQYSRRNHPILTLINLRLYHLDRYLSCFHR